MAFCISFQQVKNATYTDIFILSNGSIAIWEKDQIWFKKKGDAPPPMTIDVDTPNIDSAKTADRQCEDENAARHVQANRYVRYLYWLVFFVLIGLGAALVL